MCANWELQSHNATTTVRNLIMRNLFISVATVFAIKSNVAAKQPFKVYIVPDKTNGKVKYSLATSTALSELSQYYCGVEHEPENALLTRSVCPAGFVSIYNSCSFLPRCI